ncbi:MAG TPA: endolytic transglycosylase MltG [Elusimicrobia bacterium]|nr:endolytic transglycosylase MltG [Elusimicrobiota bacterium]
MKNKKIIIIVAIIILALLPFFISENKEVFIKIPDGSTPKQVAKILKNENIIKSENVFLTFVWFSKTEKKFKPGTYKFNTRMTSFAVLRDIINGNTYRIKVTIPEGFTAVEIAELLEKKGVCNGKKFLTIVKNKKLDGYLFPETYFFEPDSSEEKVAQMLNGQFEKIFIDDFVKRALVLKMSKEKIIILASIIEKEAKKDEERPLISAVFHNRLKRGWNLESCATVLYALGKHKDFLTYKDTKFDSPFNTYIHPGLPPAPISNPGVASIKAALYPAVSEDMFFVSDGSGTHKFSKYADEHIRNKKTRKKTID